MPALLLQDARERRVRTVQLRQRRDVAAEVLLVARLVHQPLEEREARHVRSVLAAIKIAVLAERRAMRDHHAYPGLERGAQPQRIAIVVPVMADDRKLGA